MLLEILKAVLFGVVEGITEWLPISRTIRKITGSIARILGDVPSCNSIRSHFGSRIAILE